MGNDKRFKDYVDFMKSYKLYIKTIYNSFCILKKWFHKKYKKEKIFNIKLPHRKQMRRKIW